MKFICICVFLIASMLGNITGQTGENAEKGFVSISVPLIAKQIRFEDENGVFFVTRGEGDKDYGEKNNGPYQLTLKGRNQRLSIPYISRIIARNEDSKGEYDGEYEVDKYEIRVAPGIYTIKIGNLGKYRLPNFRIAAGESVNLVIPQFLFAWNLICHDDIMSLKTNLDVDPRHSKLIPTKSVEMDIIRIEKPFFAVVYHCGKKKKGASISYASGTIWYMNHWFKGETIEIDKARSLLTAKGRENQPAEYVIDAGAQQQSKKIIFDFRNNTVVSN